MRAFCLVGLVILASISTTLATKGIDLSASFNNFSCVKNAGYSFAIVRGYKSYGEVDTVGHQNLKNAKAAGLIGDAYFFPCKGKKTASAQVTEFDNVFGSEYGTVWIDVESNPSTGCGWSSSDHTGNCQFLQDIVNAFTAKKRLVGIYASQYQWSTIMGSASSCAKFTSHPLWYAHYDNNPSFSDYPKYALGGWTTPSIKQYVGDTTLCSVGVDLNFY
ncbi:unnamed protein product [Paramecium primaurelia]|uniref:Lysozyme n=2 Tax=Paramecium TaxID=5884 RepID=A0A8S1T7T5_9CILI|nr:unnamed protein product [Paramecium primaurelia]CAD8148323.1 unnamed protein product [Paramecium pentaurelia]